MTLTVTWTVPSTLSRETRVSGRRIAWDRIGDGPPLVLIHGTPFNASVWARIAPILARRFTVHVYDLLGYGLSEMPDGDVSLGVQNQVLAALLAEWGLDRPRVLAHDFGGATALRAHLLNGCDYEKLMLFDPVALRPWGSPFVAHVREHEAAFAGAPDDIHAAMLEAYIAGAAHHPLRPEAMAAYRDPWRGETGQAAFYRQIAQMDMRFTDEIEPHYGALRCPVSLLWGVEDKWIPVERGRALKQALPDCAYREIAGAGHLMQDDAPEEIVAEALRFF